MTVFDRPVPQAGARLAAAVLLAAAAVHAQPAGAQESAAFLAASDGRTITLILASQPPRGGGFIVERRSGGGEWRQLTPDPVRAFASPAAGTTVLGADLPAVMEAVEASSPDDVLRRLQGDRFRATMLSMLMPRVALLLGRSYVDRDVQAGATYEYRVRLVDGSGRPLGTPATRMVAVAQAALREPSGLRADARDGQVSLTWSYPPFRLDAADAVVGFHVYRREATPGSRIRLTAVPIARIEGAAIAFRDEAENGRAWTYEVRAVDVAGAEGAPATITATPRDVTPPAPIPLVRTRAGDGTVEVTWDRAPEPDVAGYTVERGTSQGGTFAALTPRMLPAATTSFVDTAASGADVCFYRVLVHDRAGNISAPSIPVHAVPRDDTPPEPPARLVAVPEGRQLKIRWAPSPSADVKGYLIYRGPDSARVAGLVTEPHPRTEFTDTGFVGGLTPGGRYTVKVVAVDRWHNQSTPVFAQVQVPDDEAPPAPTGFAVTNVEGRHIEASWSAANALDVARYELTRTGQDGERLIGVFDRRAPITTRDTTAVIGSLYVYRVIAIDSAGNRGTAATDSVMFRDFSPPAAPRHVSAQRLERGVRVTWERVASRDLAGYLVFRSTMPTGVFEQLTAQPVDALEFVDAGGAAGHYYTVRAVDTSTNRSAAAPVTRVAQ